MITFKQFLNEMTAYELEMKLFFKTEVGIREPAALEDALTWWAGKLDFHDISSNADERIIDYLERKGADLDFLDEDGIADKIRLTVNAFRHAWLKSNGIYEMVTEGGKATETEGTVRATKNDIVAALKFVSKVIGLPFETLEKSLLGSTPHTLSGHKQDSGDIDIAVDEKSVDRETIVAKMEKATNFKTTKIGKGTYSFPVPGAQGRKVQVDLMFVPSIPWAIWGHYSARDSKHKARVRNNLLLDVVMQHTFQPGKDLSVRDSDGTEIVRVRRSFGRGEGLYRTFKVAPPKKNGSGRVQLRKGTPEEVAQELARMGKKLPFSKEADAILSPDQAAEFLFGKGTKATDLLSAEQVIKAIFKRKDHAAIFKDVVAAFKADGTPVPDELKKFE